MIKIVIIVICIISIGFALCNSFNLEFHKKLTDSSDLYLHFNYSQGVDLADEAILIDPTSTMGYFYKSMNLMGLGDYESSIQNLDIAIELDKTGKHPEFYYIKYLTYRSINDEVNKKLSLKTLRELTETGTIYDKSLLVYIMLIEEEYDLAKTILKSYNFSKLKRHQKRQVMEMLLIANYGCGDMSYLSKYEKYMRRNPKYHNSSKLDPFLSLYYYRLGDTKKAKSYLIKTNSNDIINSK